MPYRATKVSEDPLHYFLQKSDEGPYLRVSDVILRENKDRKEIFARMIRFATNSKWSHSALLYLQRDTEEGPDNTLFVEAKTSGIHITSWRHEVVPFHRFTIGIKRLRLDWYVETPHEISRRDADDPEDTHGISYLRRVRHVACDQVHGLYDHKTVNELTALYVERVAKRHLKAIPQIAKAAGAVADLFKRWDAAEYSATNMLRFICSGLVQYSFFEALRQQIMVAIDAPESQEAVLSNLSNMQRVIFRDDPDGIIPWYIKEVRSGRLDIRDPVPDDVLDLLKTATPADFNNSPSLAWRYVILKGIVWQIDQVPAGYRAKSEEEQDVLALLGPEHRS